MAEVLKTAKLDLKKSIVSSSVFSAASSNIASSISPMIPFGGVAKAIGSQPKSLEIDKIDVPKPSPLADIVAQLQVKFESLSSSVRANYRDIKSLKKFVKSEKKEKDNSLEETNQILEDIGQALALDFANRVTEKKEKLDLLRDSILKKKVEDEEQELEKGVKNTKETNKKLDKVIKPAKSIFNSILEFFALLGTAILAKTAFTWLEDPKNREKLAGIFTWLTEHWKWIAGGLAIGGLVLALAPLATVIGGIIGSIGLVAKAIALLAPVALPVLAIAAVAAAGWWGLNWLSEKLTGGKVLETARKQAKFNFRQSAEQLNLNTPIDELKMSGNGHLVYPATHKSRAGMPVFTKNRLGNKLWKGPANALVDPTGKSGGNSLMVWPWSQRADGSYWGTEAQRELVYKYSDITTKIGTVGTGIQGSMWDEIRAERTRVENERLPGEVGLELHTLDLYREETRRLMDLAEQEVKSKYTTKLNKLVKFHGGGTVIGEPGIDKITVKLTHGEEVINKDSADKFRYVLKDINDNSGEMWLAFQEGVKIQSEINKDNKKLISNLAATLNVLQKQTNNLVEYESNNKSLENTLLPNTFLSSSKKEEKGDGDKNWIQKFWEWFVPPAEKSNEPSVRAGVRTPQTGFSHVESMSGGTQLFGSPSTKDVSSNLKRQKTNVQVVNQTNVGDGVSVDTGNGNNTGVVPAKQGSSGKEIPIFPYDVNNSWILEAVYAYEIASPVGSVVGPQE